MSGLESRSGGTGRRTGLKIPRPLRPWGFDPPLRHQSNQRLTGIQVIAHPQKRRDFAHRAAIHTPCSAILRCGFQKLRVNFSSRRFEQVVRVEVSLSKEGGKDRTRNHHRNQHRELCLVDDSCLVAEQRTDRPHRQAGTHEQSCVSCFTGKLSGFPGSLCRLINATRGSPPLLWCGEPAAMLR